LCQQAEEKLQTLKTEAVVIEEQMGVISHYVCKSEGEVTPESTLRLKIEIDQPVFEFPYELQEEIESIIALTRIELEATLSNAIKNYKKTLELQKNNLLADICKMESEHEHLFVKKQASSEITNLLNRVNDQNIILDKIQREIEALNKLVERKNESRALICTNIAERDTLLESLVRDFNSAMLGLDDMVFRLESEYSEDQIENISAGFNKSVASVFIENGRIKLNSVFNDVESFMESMENGNQRLNRGVNNVALTESTLLTTKDIRFVAIMDGDRIGGFRKSSMTQGKQAVFALTLILSESEVLWPLLIDQPEDDLDSRSICDVIVRDLMRRKRKRQIIMATHDANLVIGADSEEVIVANKHGDDRKNYGGRTFDYLTGSLENSKEWDEKAEYILNSAGIREHACKILDGGADAFQKRKEKYRI
jgi:hypothetical protein